MELKLKGQIDKLVARQASEWISALRHGGLRERIEFVAWLKESRLHVREFLEMTAVDQELSRIDPERRRAREALPSTDGAQVVMLPTADLPSRTSASVRRAVWWGGAIAACVAAALVVVAWQLSTAEPWATYGTGRGEQRVIDLADGSTIHLNAESKLQVRLDDDERDVRLERGEALFDVATDASRPFRVHGNAVTVLAVGTSFNVYERADGTTKIAVLEGRVRITSSSEGDKLLAALATPATLANLRAGEAAEIEKGGEVRRERADVSTAVAWRERQLIFDATPLEEIVREFNRYNATQIQLDGIAPGTYRYSGIFNADDPESLAQLLARERDLAVERAGATIVIRPGPGQPPSGAENP